MDVKGFKKYLLIMLGSLSMALGLIGLILPVLPTTPFLLLAAYFYLRSSKRLYAWITNHRIFGQYIRSYLVYRAVPKRVKISAIVFLWISLALSIVLVDVVIVRVILPVIGAAVSIHIIRIKTLKPEEQQGCETAGECEDDLLSN